MEKADQHRVAHYRAEARAAAAIALRHPQTSELRRAKTGLARMYGRLADAWERDFA